jgi:AcrR family transcriptional regulator
MPKIVNHDEYRQELLEKSYNLFTRKGYNNINMKEVAAEIGVSTGTLYHYFPSKENMLAEMIAWIGFENTEEYIRRTSSVESIRDRFDMIVDYWKEKGKLYESILLLAFDMYRNTDIERWKPLYEAFAERYTAGMSERLNISRQFARSIFIYFLGLSFHAIATGSDTEEYNKQVDFLNVIFRPLIVDAKQDPDKAAQKFRDIYKTFLANLPVARREIVEKKMDDTQTLKAGKKFKKTKTKQKKSVSNQSKKK